MMQVSIFVCGKQTEEFSQLDEVLSSFIILFVENLSERSIMKAPVALGLFLVTSSCRKSNASGGA